MYTKNRKRVQKYDKSHYTNIYFKGAFFKGML